MRAMPLAPRPLAMFLGVCLIGCWLMPLQGDAQLNKGNLWPKPRLLTIAPAGGKAGTTFEVVCGGTDFEKTEGLIFSHAGIKAVLIPPPAPPKVDPKNPKSKPAPPAPPRFTVTIDKDVPLGLHDVRLVSKLGVSNPRAFHVGHLDVVQEKEPNDDVAQAQKVEIGTTIFGVIGAATDVDYYTFSGKKGQRVIINCQTASIDSRLYPEIEVFDNDQKRIAYHKTQPGADALADVTLPANGNYFVRINQFTYSAGGGEYYYLMSISTGPWIDAVFPPVVEPGRTTQLTIFGRNLPDSKVDPLSVIDNKTLEKCSAVVSAPADAQSLSRIAFSGVIAPPQGLLDGFEYRLRTPAGVSNPVLLTFAKDPVYLEVEDNDTPETAQAITVPCEVAGRIDKPKDRDWFVFEAKKGSVYVIDLLSDRLGAPTDVYFSLHNVTAKKEITRQDDGTDTLSTRGFFTTTNDPAPYRFVVPEDGKYQVMVSSHSGDANADPRQVYRLRIAPERPDFCLIVMPAEENRPDSCQLGRGGVENFLVFAQRIDGFKGEITLEMHGLPTGVTCPPQVIAGNQKSTLLAVLAGDNASLFTGNVTVTGSALIGGEKVEHEARPATVTWPTSMDDRVATMTRLDRSLILDVRGRPPGKLAFARDHVILPQGDKREVPIKLVRYDANFKDKFEVPVVKEELPPGVTIKPLTFGPGKDDLKVEIAVADTAVPGKYNVVLRGFAGIIPDGATKAVNTILPSTPLQLIILPKQVAKLSVSDTTVTLKQDEEKTISVKVARLFDYGDSFKVELVLPDGMKGISADAINIAPGQDEAKLTLKVAHNAELGPHANLIVRVIAVMNGEVSLTHETKINVNVAK